MSIRSRSWNGEIFGTTKPVAWQVNRATVLGRDQGVAVLATARVSRGSPELQVVAINHRPLAGLDDGRRLPTADDQLTFFEEEIELQPKGLRRVQLPPQEIAGWPERPEHVRIGLDPLLTANGKPYVLMRYSGGPLSIHHG